MASIGKPSIPSLPTPASVTAQLSNQLTTQLAPLGNVRDLGGYIRDQRKSAQISLRQLAAQAGVSNPYLSQIERGLRHPSAEILQQIAKALRISAEALYVQAGILDERHVSNDTTSAILADAGITERQKQVLLEIYASFRAGDETAQDRATAPLATPAPSTAAETGSTTGSLADSATDSTTP